MTLSQRVCVFLTIACAACAFTMYHWIGRPDVPTLAGFSSEQAHEWKPYGGVWSIRDGIVSDRSDERGAKLAAGSARWANYQLDLDVRPRRLSDLTGVVVRGSDLRPGPDAYTGYYVGLDQPTQSLVIGRVQSGHLDRDPVPVRGGISSGIWYHLHIVVSGCTVAAQVRSSGQVVSSSAMQDEERDCVPNGAVALLAGSRGGDWRALSLTPADDDDVRAMLVRSGPPLSPRYPIREADWARMWNQHFGSGGIDILLNGSDHAVKETGKQDDDDRLPVADLASFRADILSPRIARVRGTVTSTKPLFVQDNTAGMRMKLADAGSFNTGDEIEAVGGAIQENGELVFRAASERLLWDRAPLLPLYVSPTQASSGQFDGSLIEVTGRVQSVEKQPDGSVMLHLEDSAQAFSALLQPEEFDDSLPHVAKHSTVRVRGIGMTSRNPETDGSFLVLVERGRDVVETQSPPWWSGWRLGVLLGAATLAIAGAIAFYLRSERMRMEAVLHERERLAHDMHDTLAQNFAGLSYVLQGVRKRIVSEDLSGDLVQDMTTACELATNAHREASMNIASLHPAALAALQTPLTALEQASRPLLEQHGIVLTAKLNGEPHPLDSPLVDALFRVGMEAVSNVIRHAHAQHVTMQLRYEARTVTLQIEDDGIGNTATGSTGFGVRGMQHQCETVHANLVCRPAADHGWLVQVVAPYPRRRFLLRMRPFRRASRYSSSTETKPC